MNFPSRTPMPRGSGDAPGGGLAQPDRRSPVVHFGNPNGLDVYLTGAQSSPTVPVERKILVDLSDIELIVLECTTCGSRSSIPPERLNSFPRLCPQGHLWITGDPLDLKIGKSAFQEFARAIREIRKFDSRQHEIGFKMLLEFNDPKPRA